MAKTKNIYTMHDETPYEEYEMIMRWNHEWTSSALKGQTLSLLSRETNKHIYTKWDSQSNEYE